ncbi:MAG: peptide deformylase [Elusimicrobiota bacterium]
MIRRITKQGEEVLKKKSLPVDLAALESELPKLLDDMFETMYTANGVGLAAPQVGLSLRLAVIDVKLKEKGDPLVLINPEIISREGEVIEEEGCLSVPGLYEKVKRHAKVSVRALGADGKPWERTATGLLARAFEHEFDHLEGKLFFDHLDFAKRYAIQMKLRKLKQEKNWDL